MSLVDTLAARSAERPRIIVPDARAWRMSPDARRHRRVSVTGGGCTILDSNPPVRVRETSEVAQRDIGAEWLRWLMAEHGAKRLPWRPDQLPHLQSAQPLYAVPGSYPDMAYVDLTRAFYELYRVASMCAVYIPDPEHPVLSLRKDLTWEGAGELAELRTARNMVIGIMRSRTRTMLQKDGSLAPIDTTKQNTLLSPGLWGYMADTLHAVAADALALGAVYVNTDGYIVPGHTADRLVAHLAATWSLGATIEHRGDAEIDAPGAWKIGDHHSGTWPAARRPADQIRRLDPMLLRFLARQREFLVTRG